MTKHTNSGIFAGDTVIVYLENYASGRQNRIDMRRVKVERVTPTQVVIEGINYHADRHNPNCGQPVKQTERLRDSDDYKTSGFRKFAHPQTVKGWEWDHHEAQMDRPESLAMAQAINSDGYATLGYPFLMTIDQILELSKDPALMIEMRNKIQEVERVRREALEDGRAFFAQALGIELDQ